VVSPIVVDSSVAYKWLSHVDEERVEQALVLLDLHETGAIMLSAPSTLYVELANALRSCRHVDEERAITLITRFEELHIDLFESTCTRLATAARISYQHGISIYDALFLALAEELGCPLVTADRRAFARAESRVEIRLL
jgi:predicted nucleic acid-binding protein